MAVGIRWLVQKATNYRLSAKIFKDNRHRIRVASRESSLRSDERSVNVWHCHILEHEDNEMMRPYEVVEKPEG